MSIQSEISRLNTNVSNALAAISEKGVTVPSGSGSDELAELIRQISSAPAFSAKINVTYPSGATVTCKKGTTTLTAPDTSGSWTIIIPEAGTWTVTATQGSNSKSQSVNITTQGQVATVSLSFALVLFENGDKTSVTGGWGYTNFAYVISNPVTVGNTLAISFGTTNANLQYGTFVYTKNKIDISSISKLEAVISQCSIVSGKPWYFVISSSTTPSNTEWALGNFGTAKTSISKTGTYSLDVSRYSGQYYVGFFISTSGQANLTVRLTATKISGT